MKIVVIGGSGLIGTKLAAKLREKGHEAVAASPNSGVNTITGEGLGEAPRPSVRPLVAACFSRLCWQRARGAGPMCPNTRASGDPGRLKTIWLRTIATIPYPLLTGSGRMIRVIPPRLGSGPFGPRSRRVESGPKQRHGGLPQGVRIYAQRYQMFSPPKSVRRPLPLATTHRVVQRPPFECVALVLQGGGALGSYQAGVYQALAEADLHPDWVQAV